MKKNIFLYLFILAILALVYQQITFKKARQDKRLQIENAAVLEKEKAYQDTIADLIEENLDLAYFTLEYNDDALNYFDNFSLNPEEIIPLIKDEIYDTNNYKDQHPLIPFESIGGGKLVINKIKMINHRWIITDFNDGPYWGEIFIKYFINEDRTYTFETVDAFLYPPNR